MASEWKETTLGAEVDLLTGFPFKSSGYIDSAEGIRLVRGDNIVQGAMRWDGVKRWPQTDIERFEQFQLQPDDVVLAMDRPWIEAGLKFAAISKHDLPCLLVQRTARIRGGQNLDTRFLRYLVGSRQFTQHIQTITTGTAVPHISASQIKEFKFNLPPLPEQKAIARILGTLDDKIELNRRMNATLEAMARALFQSWFVDFDPVHAKAAGRPPSGMDAPTAALFPSNFQDSALGEIPEGWTADSVSNVFHLTMGQSPPGDTYNEAGEGTPFYQGRTDFGFRFPTRRMFCTAPTRLAKECDTLVSVRAPVGDINMAIEDCCIGRGVAAVRHKQAAHSFTYYAMANLRPHFANYESEGTVFGAINKVNFEKLPVVAPSREVLTAFEKLAGPIDEQIRINETQSRTLATLRDTLLPKLLSGELSTATAA